jgi:hypothetical protein
VNCVNNGPRTPAQTYHSVPVTGVWLVNGHFSITRPVALFLFGQVYRSTLQIDGTPYSGTIRWFGTFIWPDEMIVDECDSGVLNWTAHRVGK